MEKDDVIKRVMLTENVAKRVRFSEDTNDPVVFTPLAKPHFLLLETHVLHVVVRVNMRNYLEI